MPALALPAPGSLGSAQQEQAVGSLAPPGPHPAPLSGARAWQVHLTLSDEDVTSVTQNSWKRLNTLQHYKVPSGWGLKDPHLPGLAREGPAFAPLPARSQANFSEAHPPATQEEASSPRAWPPAALQGRVSEGSQELEDLCAEAIWVSQHLGSGKPDSLLDPGRRGG